MNHPANPSGTLVANRPSNHAGYHAGYRNAFTAAKAEVDVEPVETKTENTEKNRSDHPLRTGTLSNPNTASPSTRASRARTEIQPGRLTVRAVACVECGAEPGQPCIGRRGPRKANHATRIESYLAWAELPGRTAA